MPINRYFKGHGDEVMNNMKKEYGDKDGKEVFYATANKRGAKPSKRPKKRHSKRKGGKR